MDIDRAGQQQRVSEVKRPGARIADALDPAVADRQPGAYRGPAGGEDSTGDLLAE
jgi:hypothetical protein